jgi:hypothetical protein
MERDISLLPIGSFPEMLANSPFFAEILAGADRKNPHLEKGLDRPMNVDLPRAGLHAKDNLIGFL